MKRFSALVSKAGDYVQQASDELQRRQQEHQYKQSSLSPSSTYSTQQQYQSGFSNQQNQYYSNHHQNQTASPVPSVAHHYPSPSHQEQPYSPHGSQSPLSPTPHTGYGGYYPPPPSGPSGTLHNQVTHIQAPATPTHTQAPVTPHIQAPVTTSHIQAPVATSHIQAPVATSHIQAPVTTAHDGIESIRLHFEGEIEKETQRAQKIRQEFDAKLDAHRREGQRLHDEYEAQMVHSRQILDQISRDMRDKMTSARQEAEAEAARLYVAAEEEKRAAIEKARAAAAQAEAEALMHQARLVEAQRLAEEQRAQEQKERESQRADELATKYQAEYEENLRLRMVAAEEEDKKRQELEKKLLQEEQVRLQESKQKEDELAAKYQADYEEKLRQATEGVTKMGMTETPGTVSGAVPTREEGSFVGQDQAHQPVAAKPPPIPRKPTALSQGRTPSFSASPSGSVQPLQGTLLSSSSSADQYGSPGSVSVPLPPPPPPPPALLPQAPQEVNPAPLQQAYPSQYGTASYIPQPVYHTPQPTQNILPPPPPMVAPNTQSRSLLKKGRSEMHPCGVVPLTECLNRALPLDVDWFIHESAPLFTVCSRCYVDHIYNTQYRDAFKHQRYKDSLQVSRMCLFGTHRVLRQLWPAATRYGRFDEMLEYMKTRPLLPSCPENSSRKGLEWYTNPDMPNATWCCACFEDFIAAGPFASRFVKKNMEGGATCDFGQWFIKRMYDAKTPTNDWAGFVAEVNARLQIPACKKSVGVMASSCAWYVPRQPGMETTWICRSCFVDYFYGHTYESDFVHLPRDDYNLLTCVFSFNNLRQAARNASEKADPSIFWGAVDKIKTQQVCDAKGIVDGEWYTTPENPDEFGICGGCFHGIVETINGGHHFIRKPGVPPGVPLMCCVNPEHPRANEFLTRLVETVLTDSSKPLGEYAVTYAKVPKCPRRKSRKGTRWWGFDRLCICEECYVNFAKGTVLEAKFQSKGETVEEPRLCELYSPRMRGLYTDVCEGRLPLEEYLDLAEQRMRVYIETVPRCELLLFKQEMAVQNSQFLGLMGVMYTNIGAMQDISSGHDYTVGNSYAGYGYANENSLQGGVYSQQSFEAGQAATAMGPMMEVSMLEQRWQTVE